MSYPQLAWYYRHKNDPGFKEEQRQRHHEYYLRKKAEINARRKEHYLRNREKYLESANRNGKLRYARNRKLCLEHYGQLCACCRESTEAFLTIDHINGKTDRLQTGDKLYAFLVKNGFPEGFQTLCYNCNIAKGHRGVCPHRAQGHS